jgi:hypothetical protein
MIFIEHTTDFEFYSSTSKGAVQGYVLQKPMALEFSDFTKLPTSLYTTLL